MGNNPYLGWDPWPNLLNQCRYNYSHVLRDLGETPVVKGPWAFVRDSGRVQGWKLHLSSINVQAESLVRVVAPHLRERGTAFKIARDSRILSQLNDGLLGMTQVGKFVTIYPESDALAREIAAWLLENTQCYLGPSVVTDAHLGGIVYARYGSFHPLIVHDRLGRSFRGIYDSERRLVSDVYSVPYKLPVGLSFPFNDLSCSEHTDREVFHESATGLPNEPRLLGSRYLLIDVLSRRAKGATFLALDLASADVPDLKVIKEGKPHCQSDDYGRDVRTRLKHEQGVYNALHGKVRVPTADLYFESGERGYLPVQYIGRENIGSLAENPWYTLSQERQLEVLALVIDLFEQVAKMHALGYVHRDLSPGNIFIRNGRVLLADFDLAYEVGGSATPFEGGTPGFASPQQFAGKEPNFSDDVYALGCEMIYLLGGVHTRFIVTEESENRRAILLKLFGGADRLADIVNRCVNISGEARPSLAQLTEEIGEFVSRLRSGGKINGHSRRCLSGRNAVGDEIPRAARGLLDRTLADPSGLWLSSLVEEYPPGEEPFLFGHHQLRRSAYSGVAGPVYTLALLVRHGLLGSSLDTAIGNRVQGAVLWLASQEKASDSDLPGLFFGDAGVAVAIAEAVTSGLVPKTPVIDSVIWKALSKQPDWPDITHGAAGQGIAALATADRLADSNIATLSHRYARYLIDTQQEDGSWKMPTGADGVSGQVYSGFAHGVSGIAYFLAEYSRRFPQNDATRAWEKAVSWLLSTANNSGNGLLWRISDADERQWKFWCHGSPGIALLFLRLFEQTGKAKYGEVAEQSLRSLPKNIPVMNLSLCHGSAGVAEIYLEAARVLGGSEWLKRAMDIRQQLLAVAWEREGAAAWLVEDSVSADLMIGASGVAHFLLKSRVNGQLGFPLLMDPIVKAA